MKRLYFILVLITVLFIPLSTGFAQEAENSSLTIRFDTRLAPAKFRLDGEYQLPNAGVVFGGAIDFKIMGADLTVMIGLAPQINSLADGEVQLGEIVVVDFFKKFSAGLFWDFWRSGDGNGWDGFEKHNTGFVLSYDLTL